jgi:hypothetical protein
MNSWTSVGQSLWQVVNPDSGHWLWFVWIAIGLLGILLLWIGLSQWLTWWRRPYHSPQRLFGQLCRLHGLGRKNRARLQRLAREAKLDDPSCLFVDPQLWDAMHTRLQSIDADVRPVAIPTLEALRAKLLEAPEIDLRS